MSECLDMLTETNTAEKGRRYFLATDSSAAVWHSRGVVVNTVPVAKFPEHLRYAQFRWPNWTTTSPVLRPKLEYWSLRLDSLHTRRLRRPLQIVVESDDDGYIVRTAEVPQVYGYGDDVLEALLAFRHELESLHFDLQQDDNFTDDWMPVKRFLQDLIDD